MHSRTKEFRNALIKKYGYDPYKDQRSVHYIRCHNLKTGRFVVCYSNGDGQVFYDGADCKNHLKEIVIGPNKISGSSIAYIRDLNAYVNSMGSSLIVNLQPARCSTYWKIDLDYLHRILPGCTFIDMQKCVLQNPTLWNDGAHLSLAGNIKYTKKLCQKLMRYRKTVSNSASVQQ